VLNLIQAKCLGVVRWGRFVIQSFLADQCLLRASALTYTTALSIVPFLAVAFSISKGFGFQNTQYIREFLLRLSAGRETVVEHIIDYINQTNVGTLGAVGVGMLLITVFTLLSTIEKSLNTIWGVKKSRTLDRKFADYLSVTLVSPLLIIVALSFTASLENSELVQDILAFSVFSYVYLLLLKALPYLMVIIALFFIYKFIPNTRVEARACLIGAVLAGGIWQFLQHLFITYQIGVSKYNAIYGSFAQLPLFLLWLYVSWVVVLLGAEIGFGLLHFRTGTRESSLGTFNLEAKEKLALAVMLQLAGHFERDRGVLKAQKLANELDYPIKLINELLFVLERLGYVVFTSEDDQQGVVLARSPHSFSVVGFLRSFREYRDEAEPFELEEKSSLKQVFDDLYGCVSASGFDVPLAELSRKVAV
jgi:membrane protein